ncbi:MAG: helix-turn-helix domain-containing protein [Bacteroidia bacterium]|nr:helix-turn-helix domain-containing protein [Bacteroidia bacterium]
MTDKKFEIKNKLDKGETFKISPFKEKIIKTSPHKHDNYYEIIFLECGEGFHFVESDKFQVSTPEVYFLLPGQLHCWQFTSIPKGYVILFKDTFFDELEEKNTADLYRKINNGLRINLDNDSYPYHLLKELHNEYKNSKTYSTDIIHGFLRIIFAKLLQHTDITDSGNNQQLSTYQKFKKLLVTECPKLHKVTDYANILCTSPQNLNAVCRKQSGKSASELINNQIMLEAKRYLIHTDYTITEITDQLNFTDTSNFIKFFKNNTGVTPTLFRKQNSQ